MPNLQTDGYVILPAHIPAAVVTALLAAARSLTAAARAGHWPHLRTLPKQFPPWERSPEAGIWGVQHLLHPDLPLARAQRDAFAELYFGEEVLGPVREILGAGGSGTEEAWRCNGDEGDGLVMELFNMLVAPERDFALRWHRDDVSFELDREAEAAALGLVPLQQEQRCSPGQGKRGALLHTQYNIPLLPDCSLHVVPGSHLRPRTKHEVELLAADPYTDELPGWIEVELQPGDVVFYDNNLIHRGVYRADTERYTLHGSVGHIRAGSKRARNVLQHGWEWVGRCDFGGMQSENDIQRAEEMRARLVALGSSQGDVGFSHDD